MKKVMYLVVCMLLIFSVTACQSTSPSPSAAATPTATPTTAATEASTATTAAAEPSTPAQTEPIAVKYIIPGALGSDQDKVMAALNQKLAQDNVGITVSVEAIDWSVWADKLNLKFTSNEEFDMFQIMQDWIPYNSYYSKGELVDVTDLLDKYGPVVKQKVPQEMWNDSKIGGKNYIIPTYWVDLSIDSLIMYRADVFAKDNIQVPQTPDDILQAFNTARADWKGANKPILNFSIPSYNAAVLQLDPKLHRYYDDYPYLVKDAFFQVLQDGTVKSWFESEDFKKDCAFMNSAYKDGIIQPDVLSVNFDWANNYQSNGDWLMFTSFPDIKTMQKNNPDIKPDDVKSFMLAPSKQILRGWGIKNCNGVSVTTKHPEGPVMFINWLWSKQDNYDLYAYGIKGTNWNPDPNNARGILNVNDPKTNANNYQNGADWMIGNIDMIRYDCTGFMAYNSIAYKANPDATNSIAGCFFFDATPVATEYSNLQAEAAKVMTPIVMGVQDYATYYPAAIQALKTAGLDKVIAEYQKQLTANIAARK